MATIRVGISGWRYEPWRGTFYPKGLPQRAELQYASSVLPVIEINGSFYSLQRPSSYASWYEQTPAGFLFTLKGPRFITHMRRLHDVAEPVANFLASGIFALKEKLGPLLWQFPPNFPYDRERMRAFFELLPHDTERAGKMAQKRSPWMKGRDLLEVDAKRVLRHAVEIRNASFLDTTFVELLRDYHVGLVVAETARRWPMPQDITADFVYMRLHGDKELYRSGYAGPALERWAKRIRAWHEGAEPADADRISPQKAPAARARDIYCFFDNTDVKLRAPFDAQTLLRKLGLRTGIAAGSGPDNPRAFRSTARKLSVRSVAPPSPQKASARQPRVSATGRPQAAKKNARKAPASTAVVSKSRAARKRAQTRLNV